MIKRFWASSIIALAILNTPYLAMAQNTVRDVPQDKVQMQLSFAPLVKKAMPAVVNVYAARQVKMRSPFANDPFFEQFFGRRNAPSRMQSSLGSGVIVDQSGLIITNYHVIRDADEIKVALSDGREFESKVLLKDEATDIAVLKIEAKTPLSFPALTLGDSDAVEVGDLVLAVGNPFGVGQTVTSGIVSAQARTRVGISDFDFFIQTDAAINPGNSGGALIDMKGQLIGINTAIYSRSGGSVGIGFAIPANLVRAVLETVKHGGDHFEPPYIGATFQNVTPDVAEGLGMTRPYGALVTDVMEGSPAQKAGLKVGDVVLSVQGQRVDDPDTFGYRLMTAQVGSTLPIEYMRHSTVQKAEIKLETVSAENQPKAERIGGKTPLAGAEVMNLTPQNSRRFRLPLNNKGVVIADVDQNENASVLFQRGDIIRVINGVEINTVDDLKKFLAQGTPQIWRFEYMRNGMLIRQFVR